MTVCASVNSLMCSCRKLPRLTESVFAALCDDPDSGGEDRGAESVQMPPDADEDDGFAVVRDDTKHRLRQKQAKKSDSRGTIPCVFREFCTKGNGCSFGHTAEEIELFEAHMGKSPYKLRKLKACTNLHCVAYSKRCPFKHKDEEWFCISCADFCPEQHSHREFVKRLFVDSTTICSLRTKGYLP
mmetsp:Transcript_108116/g.290297  ORF Transcript_108116/g.290297 Transcript_108116/m.290297 type:complete len:185 (-) Transcript_108116:103-657(-)